MTPGALYGFAVGTLLTGLCFLVVIAVRRARRAARPDYYAAPGDTHSSIGEPADFPLPTDFPEPADLSAPELVAAPVGYATADSAETEEQTDPAIVEPAEQELPLEFGDPVVEVLAPAASAADFEEEEAEADRYVPEIFPTVPSPYVPSLGDPTLDDPSVDEPGLDELSPYPLSPYASSPFTQDPFDEDPSMPDPYAAADAFGYDYDILLPDHHDDDARQVSRGYRSKHRVNAAETLARRPEARHRAPRHAAPSARFSSRTSSRQAPVPMVPAGS